MYILDNKNLAKLTEDCSVFDYIFAVEVLYAAIAFLGEKTRFPSSLEQMVATGATNGTKWFLQL